MQNKNKALASWLAATSSSSSSVPPPNGSKHETRKKKLMFQARGCDWSNALLIDRFLGHFRA